ncbi:MAG: hypothetical protein A3B37_02165 [Candidatus Sungbacteria bacterium RIFCSPLOWO2_01_FULL_59_16]|uniref:Uncharacterized protein n=1 Tax=Candidatus Sungbacteria bacterium RIFCSPLOWO2_01_FULL_59_16 TaxID=1802280 RepID=A0A1G2LD65_9BACT|nr:MAG: hypothetical protein A3B37_02165 [Candidatus Sungbacteria bacterium RIFCSPLOWO2_01_FULL_59_16]
MSSASFWKAFVAVFAVAFAANVAVSYIWSQWFHSSGWQWDTTTATAAVTGFVVTYIVRRKK